MIFEGNYPIYLQIVDIMKRKIILEEFKKEEKLPSVRELSVEFKVNPNTVQRSYQILEGDGLVFTERGIGRFITEDKEVINKMKEDIIKEIVDEFIVNIKKYELEPKHIFNMLKEVEERLKKESEEI